MSILHCCKKKEEDQGKKVVKNRDTHGTVNFSERVVALARRWIVS